MSLGRDVLTDVSLCDASLLLRLQCQLEWVSVLTLSNLAQEGNMVWKMKREGVFALTASAVSPLLAVSNANDRKSLAFQVDYHELSAA